MGEFCLVFTLQKYLLHPLMGSWVPPLGACTHVLQAGVGGAMYSCGGYTSLRSHHQLSLHSLAWQCMPFKATTAESQCLTSGTLSR